MSVWYVLRVCCVVCEIVGVVCEVFFVFFAFLANPIRFLDRNDLIGLAITHTIGYYPPSDLILTRFVLDRIKCPPLVKTVGCYS